MAVVFVGFKKSTAIQISGMASKFSACGSLFETACLIRSEPNASTERKIQKPLLFISSFESGYFSTPHHYGQKILTRLSSIYKQYGLPKAGQKFG